MIFKETKLQGAFVIELEKKDDARGFFARAFCQNEFAQAGLQLPIIQVNVSSNFKKGTLRGMHFQAEPYGEVKLIRCTRGAIYDVIIDLRKGSPTHKQWFGVELTGNNYKMLYVPDKFAHGYLTLEDSSDLLYFHSQAYVAGYERGVRYDDPAFRIQWPSKVAEISKKDASWPLFGSVALEV